VNRTHSRSLGLILLCVVVLVGCKRPDRLDPNANGYQSPITSADITYAELVQRYNQTVESFGTLWTRTDVDIEWVDIDEDGDRKYRSESGDGKFIMRGPQETALTVEKLGKIYLWAGSNAEHYWLFDRVDGDNKTAYIGAFEKIAQPGRRPYPLPVRPEMVPYLIGVVPLPEAEALGDDPPPVDLYEGKFLVDLRSLGMRMLIDPETFRPHRVDLTNRAGFSMLTSKLSGSFPVEVDSVPKAQRPTICKKAEVYVSGYESRLTVSMDYATTSSRKVRDPMFDFEMLKKALKPDRVELLDRE